MTSRPTPVKRYHDYLLQTVNDLNVFNKWFVSPLNLGGVPGLDGGSGVPLAGIVGQLIQTAVTYDTSESATLYTPPSGMSLLDNLNHIRYWINERPKLVVLDESIEIASGVRVLDFIGAPVTVTLASGFTDRVNISISGTGGGGGETVKVSSDDTTANYLENKVTAGSAKITVTTANPGANEERQVDFGTVDITDLDDVTTAGVTQGEVLTYDGADWVPSGVVGAVEVQQDDVQEVAGATILNFEGAVTVLDEGAGKATITISGVSGSGIAGVQIEEGGVSKVTDATILNFTSGATITDAGGGQADIAISGGGGGSSTFSYEDVTSQVPGAGDNYTLAATPASGTLVVHLNGLTQQPNNYTITSSGFHTLFTATSGDELTAEYYTNVPVDNILALTLTIQSGGAEVATNVSTLNFEGMIVSDDGGGQVTVSGGTGSGGVADFSIWMPDAPPGTRYSADGTEDDEFDDSSFDTGIWTEFDPGTAQTVSETEYGLTLVNTGGNDNVQGIYQPVPSGVTNWSFTTYPIVPWDRDNGHRSGILLIEDITDLPNTDCFLFANYRGGAGYGWQGIYMTDYNSWSADDYNEVNVNSTPFAQYLRFRSNGSDWHFDWSPDGKTWHSEQYIDSSPTRFTATGIGVGTKFDNSSMIGIFPFARFRADFAKTQILYGDRVDMTRT